MGTELIEMLHAEINLYKNLVKNNTEMFQNNVSR